MQCVTLIDLQILDHSWIPEISPTWWWCLILLICYWPGLLIFFESFSSMIISDFVVVQLLSHVWFLAVPWTAACQASLSFTISWTLLKFMSIDSMILFNHFFLCHPLLLLSIFPSIRIFSSESALHMRCWHKVLELQLQSLQWIFSVDFISDTRL